MTKPTKIKKKPSYKSTGMEFRGIEPRNDKQIAILNAWNDGNHLIMCGAAGTGKTFIATAAGLYSLSSDDTLEKLVIVRSAVPSRNIGFMPGDDKEKGALFEAPYIGIFGELFGRGDAYGVMKNNYLVDFKTTSYLRGLTIRNAIVIIEEFQNMSFQELDTTITRLGENTRLIVTGDLAQTDLDNAQDSAKFIRILQTIKNFRTFEFDWTDVQRSGLVKDYLRAKEKCNS